ncbi:ATP adenylyltransferase family protein [Burkholderia sp. MR1-5-21]
MNDPLRLQPGTLWPAVLRQAGHALACGALRPIETTQTTIDDGGVRFLVREVSSLARKDDEGQKRQARQPSERGSIDPFLPCDPDLFVADITDTHVAVLNKFNVIDHHLLIVTRRFEPQEALLTAADFTALFACMAEFQGVGFYNGGAAAGASQSHKHLQIVPLPFAAGEPTPPIAPLLASARDDGSVCAVTGFAFPHAFARLALSPGTPQTDIAQRALRVYRDLLDATGLHAIDVAGEAHQSAPYNLLVMPQGMLLVPRSIERIDGISINALAFAGSLFVRDAAQMQVIRTLGPMTVLQRVAGAPAAA